MRFSRSLKKRIDKPAEGFVTLIYQEHCEEEMRVSESSKALCDWIVDAPKTSAPEAKIEQLTKEQRPLHLLVEGFVRHDGSENPNVEPTGAPPTVADDGTAAPARPGAAPS